MTLAEAIEAADVLAAARAYVAAGLSVIPVKGDGSKSPKFGGWREYTKRVATDAELCGWFQRSQDTGIGVVPGPASGNLVVLDFECLGGNPAFSEWLVGLANPLAVYLTCCPIVRTPSGGRHVWVKLEHSTPGGKLARYAKGKTKVEIRGEGHMVLAPGCPAACHPSGAFYAFEGWGWLQ